MIWVRELNSIDQDWKSESDKAKADNGSSSTESKSITIPMKNIADTEATVDREDSAQTFKIPKSGSATVTIKGTKDPSTFSARDPDGNKLMINGNDNIEVKANEDPPTFVIHKKGMLSFFNKIFHINTSAQ